MSATKAMTTTTSTIGTNHSYLNGVVQLKHDGLVTLSKQNSLRIAFQNDFITRCTFEKRAASLKIRWALGVSYERPIYSQRQLKNLGEGRTKSLWGRSTPVVYFEVMDA